MNRFIALYLLIFTLIGTSVDAQQLPIFSLYNENGWVLNPGITGADGLLNVSASYRHQWTEIDDGPKTVSGGFSLPVYQKGDYFQKARNYFGLGAFVLNDQTGPTSYLQGSISYAYHISFNKINPFSWARFLRKAHVSLGLTASVIRYKLNSAKFQAADANDQLLITANDGDILPNAGAGLYFYYDKFYLGFSVPQMIPLEAKFEDQVNEASLKRVTHYYLVVGGKIPLGPDVQRNQYHKFYLLPMAWFKAVRNAPYQYDFYLRARYKNTFWVGVGYRSSKTIVADIGVLIKERFKVGYAIDNTVAGALKSYLGNTHEIVLSYNFDYGKFRR